MAEQGNEMPSQFAAGCNGQPQRQISFPAATARMMARAKAGPPLTMAEKVTRRIEEQLVERQNQRIRDEQKAMEDARKAKEESEKTAEVKIDQFLANILKLDKGIRMKLHKDPIKISILVGDEVVAEVQRRALLAVSQVMNNQYNKDFRDLQLRLPAATDKEAVTFIIESWLKPNLKTLRGFALRLPEKDLVKEIALCRTATAMGMQFYTTHLTEQLVGKLNRYVPSYEQLYPIHLLALDNDPFLAATAKHLATLKIRNKIHDAEYFDKYIKDPKNFKLFEKMEPYLTAHANENPRKVELGPMTRRESGRRYGYKPL